MITLICRVCGHYFDSARKDSKACSSACKAEIKRQYSRKHYSANKEAYKRRMQQYNATNKSAVKRRQDKWVKDNRDRVNAWARAKHAIDPSAQRRYAATYLAKHGLRRSVAHAQRERIRRAKIELGADAPSDLIEARVMIAAIRGTAVKMGL